MKKVLLTATVFCICFSSMAVKIKKHRDKIRLAGYGVVEEVKTIDYDPVTNESVVIKIEYFCRTSGEMKCRSQDQVVFESDFETLDLNGAEKAQAQILLDDAEDDLDNGGSGSTAVTITFIRPDNSSYTRTFAAVWVTNTDETQDLELTISDAVEL